MQDWETMDLHNFLLGVKQVEKLNSPINGELTVLKDFAWGTYIKAGGVTQSGGVAKLVWTTSLTTVANNQSRVTSCLILGLGGGSIVTIVKSLWPECKVTGVDIDPVIVGLGEKYLGLDKRKTAIVIGDSFDFVTKTKNRFDLICVDMYVGHEFPNQFGSDTFLKRIHKLLTPGGVVVFNRLFFGGNRPQAIKFGDKLEKVFKGGVQRVYPEANIMFICHP